MILKFRSIFRLHYGAFNRTLIGNFQNLKSYDQKT